MIQQSETTGDKMPEGVGVNYHIDSEAHDGLNALFAQPSDQTQWKHRQQFITTDDGIRPDSSSTSLYPRYEGVSHHLNMLSVFFSIEDWTDNRPDMIRRQHEFELNRPDPPSYRAAKDDPLGSKKYEVAWVLPTDTHIRLSQQYRFQDHTRDYLYRIAKLHKMAPLARASGLTAYVSACLEAIGIGYLLPPVGYEYVMMLPNGAKARYDVIRRRGHKLYGNHAHIPLSIKPLVPITIQSLKDQGLWED